MQTSTQLALGTVQFGMSYGVTRRGEGPDAREVLAILDRAAASGVRMLDTAAAYGSAEARIGHYLAGARDPGDWQIVTKLPPDVVDGAGATVRRSIDRLGGMPLYAVMAHRASTFLDSGGEAVWRDLCEVREAGLVGRIGVSVYTPRELDAVYQRYPIDIVQLPFNVYDRRFQAHIAELAAMGVEVHLRSALLQGVLAHPASALPTFLQPLAPDQDRLFDLLARYEVSPLTGALAVCAKTAAHRIVVGCQSPAEFDQLAAAFQTARCVPATLLEQLQDDKWGKSDAIVDPRFWPI